MKEKKEAAIREEEKKRLDYKAGRQIGVRHQNRFAAHVCHICEKCKLLKFQTVLRNVTVIILFK